MRTRLLGSCPDISEGDVPTSQLRK